MRKYYFTFLFSAAVSFCLFACNPKTETGGSSTEEPTDPVVPDTEEDWSWTNGYPKGVSVEEFEETFTDGQKCLGFVATIDFNANPNLTFNCLLAKGKQKPTEFFSSFSNEEEVACLATNAGYFAGYTSVSMCIHKDRVKQRAWASFNWPNDENAQRTIYPVRSAIGQDKDGSFAIHWAYCTDIPMAEHTAFPSALGNNEKTQTFLDAAPTADVEGAFTWAPYEAVGGGPRLVQNGKNVAVENYWAECLDAGGTSGLSRVNRTAAGITPDGKLILIVADGRGQRGSAGYTLSELADKFISLGCSDALNLDGGGSSCMVGAEGKILNSPSDKAGERSVTTAIVIGETSR